MDDESQDPGGKLRLGRQREAESDAERRRAELVAAAVGRELTDAARADAIRALGSIDPDALEAVAARVLETRPGAAAREALMRALLGRSGEEALRSFATVLRRDAPAEPAWRIACACVGSSRHPQAAALLLELMTPERLDTVVADDIDAGSSEAASAARLVDAVMAHLDEVQRDPRAGRLLARLWASHPHTGAREATARAIARLEDPDAIAAVLGSKEAYARGGGLTPEIRAALERGLELRRLERLACGVDVEGSGEEAMAARDAAVSRLMGLDRVFERFAPAFEPARLATTDGVLGASSIFCALMYQVYLDERNGIGPSLLEPRWAPRLRAAVESRDAWGPIIDTPRGRVFAITAARALGELRDRESAPALLRLLDAVEDREAVDQILQSLAYVDAPEAAPRIRAWAERRGVSLDDWRVASVLQTLERDREAPDR